MKEIRAYIRRGEVNQVVERLRDAGVPGVSIIEIHPLGYGYEANPFERYKAGLVDRHRYLAIVKLEIVCAEAQLERLVKVIEAHCRTGVSGDGMIFVSDVVEAVRICDGARGELALTEKRLGKEERDARAPAVA
ncbi:MAG: P-II family nitrogen regulator [Candidatus Rokuibacteriota bacterium]